MLTIELVTRESWVHVAWERHVSIGHLGHRCMVVARAARHLLHASLAISWIEAEWSLHTLVSRVVALTLFRVCLLSRMLHAVWEAHVRQRIYLFRRFLARADYFCKIVLFS